MADRTGDLRPRQGGQSLRDAGLSISEIAAEMNVPRTSVHRALRQSKVVSLVCARVPGSAVQTDVISALVNLGIARASEQSKPCAAWTQP